MSATLLRHRAELLRRLANIDDALAALADPTSPPPSPPRDLEITKWVTAADVRNALGCGLSTAYEHLHRAGAAPSAGGSAPVRVSREAWESYASETFEGTARPRERRRPATQSPRRVLALEPLSAEPRTKITNGRPLKRR